MYKIVIDATNIQRSIYKQWQGSGSFKRYANTRKAKQYITDKLNSIIQSDSVAHYDIRLNDYTITIYFHDYITQEELLSICNNELISNDIFAHVDVAI